MVRYFFRVGFLLLWHSWVGKRAESGKPFRIKMRAWPWHCDAYLHLNNAAYLRLAEDARWAWTARTPLLRHVRSEGWMFFLGGADLLFRRKIRVFSQFEVVCRIIGADERWLFFSQEFTLPDGRVACRVLVRAMVRTRKNSIAPAEVAAAAQVALPPSHEELERWKALSACQLAALRPGVAPP